MSKEQDRAVVWKTLGEVAEIGTGKSNRQDEEPEGEYPFYVRSATVLRSSRYEFDEQAVIVPGEGGIGDIYHYVSGKYALHQRAYRIHVLEANLLPKFLYYYMTNSFKQYIEAKNFKGTVSSIRKPMLAAFPIPIPPISEQERIVGILDKFCELTHELTHELTLRKKQYAYYRERLLTFPQTVERKALGEVAEVRGRIGFRGYTRKDMVERGEGAIALTASNIRNQHLDLTEPCTYISWEKYEESPEIMVRNGDIIMCQRGSVGKTALIRDLQTEATINPQLLLLTNIQCNSSYLQYWMSGNAFQDALASITAKGTVQMITQRDVRKLLIPIPPLSEQERIVEILDKFSALTESISEGLPYEIELRKKQYAYYREKLLTFPQPSQATSEEE